jgi:hypothetical protein
MNVIAELFVIFGVALLIAMLALIFQLLIALWDATIGRFLAEERQCSQIDELCGHDWNPQTMIQDEIEE